MPAEGVLLQLDGSRHDWLEDRGPRSTRVGAIDDATGRVPAAVFRDEEHAAAYLEVLAATVGRHGLPGAVYHDRHGAFAPTAPGRLPPGAPAPLSQVGRALAELGIGSIVARSAQAKGRIERLWGTFQDRLVAELRLDGAIVAFDRDRELAVRAAPPDPGQLRAQGRCEPTRASSGQRLRCPGRRRRITPGDGSDRAPDATSSD